MRRQLLILVALAAASLAGAVGGAAQAASVPHLVTGHWAGFSLSSIGDPNLIGDPNQAAALSLEVTSQRGRRFEGELVGLGGPDTIPVEGTVAESGRLSIVGHGERVGIVVIGGNVAIACGERVGVGHPCPLEGRYELRRADGSSDRGRLVAVHQVPDPLAPSIAGPWEGGARAVGDPNIRPVEALFAQDRDGALGGELAFNDPPDADTDPPDADTDPPDADRTASFDLAGQVASGERGAGVAIAGGGSEGLILLSGELGQSSAGSQLELDYLLFREVEGPGPAELEEGSIVLGQSP